MIIIVLVLNDGSIVLDKSITGKGDYKGDEVVKPVVLPSSCLGPTPKSRPFRPYMWVHFLSLSLVLRGFSQATQDFPSPHYEENIS